MMGVAVLVVRFDKQLFKHFGVHKELPEEYGRSRDWNVDLIPKFLMASGERVKYCLNF